MVQPRLSPGSPCRTALDSFLPLLFPEVGLLLALQFEAGVHQAAVARGDEFRQDLRRDGPAGNPPEFLEIGGDAAHVGNAEDMVEARPGIRSHPVGGLVALRAGLRGAPRG